MNNVESDVIMAICANVEARLNDMQLPIKQPGRVFEIPNDQKYLELIIISNNSAEHWGDEKTYAGLVRVIVHWPLDDEGWGEPLTRCNDIVWKLPKGLELKFGAARLMITTAPLTLNPLPDGQETLFPVSFGYSSALVVQP